MLLWVALLICGGMIVFSGTRLSRYGDVIAEKSGLGRSWIGVVLMATVTSLPELVTGVSAVTQNLPDIAVGDVLGSCVFNMVILALLDLVERETTLSAKAHHGHVLSAGFGILLLSLVGVSIHVGDRILPVGWLGFYSVVVVGVYLFSMRTIYAYEKRELARFIDLQAQELRYESVTTKDASLRFGLNALIVVAAAVVLPTIAVGIAEMTGLGQTFVGNILVAFTTSLPEIVVCLAAVRIGALDLAIGNLLGSNICNIFILFIDDLFFLKGPILSYASNDHIISALAAIAATAIMVSGLTYRSEKKILFLAWDSMAVVMLYFSYLALLFLLR